MKVRIKIELDEADNITSLKSVLDEFAGLGYDLENISIGSYNPELEALKDKYRGPTTIYNDTHINHGFIDTPLKSVGPGGIL